MWSFICYVMKISWFSLLFFFDVTCCHTLMIPSTLVVTSHFLQVILELNLFLKYYIQSIACSQNYFSNSSFLLQTQKWMKSMTSNDEIDNIYEKKYGVKGLYWRFSIWFPPHRKKVIPSFTPEIWRDLLFKIFIIY